jgi:pyruvate carboxylase
MSAVVVEVRVHEGQDVKAGDPSVPSLSVPALTLTLSYLPRLFVLSAMKMEQIVSAPVSGKVTRVCVKESDRCVPPPSLSLVLVLTCSLSQYRPG